MLPGQTAEDWAKVSDGLCQTFGAQDCCVRSVMGRPRELELWFLITDPSPSRWRRHPLTHTCRRRGCRSIGWPWVTYGHQAVGADAGHDHSRTMPSRAQDPLRRRSLMTSPMARVRTVVGTAVGSRVVTRAVARPRPLSRAELADLSRGGNVSTYADLSSESTRRVASSHGNLLESGACSGG